MWYSVLAAVLLLSVVPHGYFLAGNWREVRAAYRTGSIIVVIAGLAIAILLFLRQGAQIGRAHV